MVGVPLSAIVTNLASAALAERALHAQYYRQLENKHGYWVMVDLAGSARYRATYGPEAGYIQGETFLQFVRATLSPYPTVTVLKELGDAVLFRAGDFRDVLEALVLMSLAAAVIDERSQRGQDRFSLRCGVTFGQAKSLERAGVEDYLGESIDRLSRLMSVRSSRATIVVDQDVARNERHGVLPEYPFLSLGSLLTLPDDLAKGFPKPIRYHELFMDRGSAMDFKDFFSPWRD